MTPRPLLSLALLPALAFACGGAPAEPAPAAASEPLASSAPEALWLLHSCDDPGCVVAARRPALATALCPDGQVLPSCPVAGVDWPAPPPASVQALTLAPRQHERMAVRARFRPDGSLAVTQAFARVGEQPAAGRLVQLSPRECAHDGCDPLRGRPLDGRRPWSTRWLDLSLAPGSGAAHNAALVEAHGPDGLLAIGDPRGRGAHRRFVAHDYFLPLSFSPSLCGDELRDALALAAEGLLWPSESDFPLAPLLAPLADAEAPLDAPLVAQLAGLPPELPAERRGLSVFDWNGRNDPDLTADERARAARFRALRAVLEANLSSLDAFYLGQVDLHVLIVGRSRCGELAGLATMAVET